MRALFDSRADGSYIGVQVSDVEAGDGVAAATEGAVVTEVVEGDPAAAAGIEAGDVLVEFDGERIRGVRQLTRVVRETPAGRTVAATVLRDGARLTVNVTPSERSRPGWRESLRRIEIPERAEAFVWRGDSALLEGLPDIVDGAFASLAGRARLGIRGESVDGQLAEYFGVSAGVLVRHVEEDTVAAAAGLRAGDVITAIDGEQVEDLGVLRRRLAALDSGASFTISIMRDGAAMSLAAELAEEAERRPRGLRRGAGV
ncbi:MAG: PDZ domain-containing protein [Acidobacteria bacterium]|nr:PDZ domain-containing protein [Acidobacteriota bacterium]